MAMVINTNVASLNAQRNLTLSQNDMSTAMERLSSGKRINTAGDDAAGLAISNRLTSQVRGLNQAIRNANDGISLIQTAEGALDETTNILQRMRELAIQSANGIYSDANRSTLQAEVEQLILEMDRISATTTFNGLNILDGTLGSIDLQAGATANELISFSIGATDSNTLGLGGVTSDLNGDRISSSLSFDDGDIVVNGVGLSGFDIATDNLEDLFANINESVAGVTAAGFNVVSSEGVGTGVLSSNDTLRITVASIDGQPSVNYDITSTNNLDELVAAINEATGGKVEASVGDSGNLVLSNSTGGAITLTLDADGTPGFSAASEANSTLAAVTGLTAANATTYMGSIALTSDDGSAIEIVAGANGTKTDLNNLGFQVIAEGSVTGGGLSSGNQTTALSSGDLTINGVAIPTTDTDSLLGKIEAINSVTDETGVTASAGAAESYAADLSSQVVELTASVSFTAPDVSFANIVGSSALSVDGFGGTDSIAIDITDGNGTYTVTVVEGTDFTVGSEEEFVASINAAILADDVNNQAIAYIDDNGALAFRNETSATLSIDGVTYSGTAGVLDAATGLALEGSGTTNLTNTADRGLNINGIDVSVADGVDGIISSSELVTAINAASANTGVTAYIDDSDQLHLYSDSSITLDELSTGGDLLSRLAMQDSNGSAVVAGTAEQTTAASAIPAGTPGADVGSIKINGTEVSDIDFNAGIDSVVAQLNAVQGDTGVRASIDENGQLLLDSSSRITFELGQENGLATATALGINFTLSANVYGSVTVDPSVTLTSVNPAQAISIDVTANGATATGLKDLNTDLSSLVNGTALSSINIGTAAGAQNAIGALDNALEQINDIRSELGAINNRLDFTINNLSSVSENAAASRSRVMDADFAAESAALSRAQVLQQAGTAMLAQANAQPQQVLSLLQ
ncbi:MAG: hypothetical protein HWE20_03610 [Gammaproteobacteria bacterium]|nr:hypothetical protein [Gammaproteobacteria bacterium]